MIILFTIPQVIQHYCSNDDYEYSTEEKPNLFTYPFHHGSNASVFTGQKISSIGRYAKGMRLAKPKKFIAPNDFNQLITFKIRHFCRELTKKIYIINIAQLRRNILRVNIFSYMLVSSGQNLFL